MILVVCGFAEASAAVDFNNEILPILARNCLHCHGPDDKTRQGDLRLDQREGAFRTNHPVIVSGEADASLLIQRITSDDPELRMPPPDAKQQLSGTEIEAIRRWINEGAAWHDHWSFLAVQHRPPAAGTQSWSREVIDDFIAARLELRQVQLSPEASRQTLSRRLTLDLIGLPPTVLDQQEFLADNRPDAYERLIDRLLASPHFGERWGRHWLDAARYADSSGFEGDPPRAVWKYRDWVLKALNEDLPFDQFVIRQLAGDLLPSASTDDRVATGFLLNSQQDGGSEPARLDAVVDRVNTIGTVFLGLTVGCAQCHSHKFDPISQREYYALFAFVNSADESRLEFASATEIARRDALASQRAALTAERTAYAAKLPKETVESDPGYQERSATIDLLSKKIPHFDSTPVLQPAPDERVTTTYIRGEFARPGEAVTPDVPRILPPMPDGGRTRLEFARWLVSPNQPLTPRVNVNRIWQQLFGRGLVETENDFGAQGARPTHPELLDWLAAEFSQQGWQTKRLVRTIVSASTYRQSSQRRSDLDSIDPENRWLARQARLRLEAESIRDCALAIAGLLSTKMSGPSVFPFQHEGIMINRATPAPWTISPGEDRYRRGIYTYYWRLTPHPQLQTFDAPDAITACTRRQTSNTPLQALTLLNDPLFVEAAEHLARQLVSSGFTSDDEIVNQAVQISLQRLPLAEERQLLKQLLSTARSRPTTRSQDETRSSEERELAAWKNVASTLLNLEEFIIRE